MKCRYCLGTESKVVDSRPTDDGTSIRRRMPALAPFMQSLSRGRRACGGFCAVMRSL